MSKKWMIVGYLFVVLQFLAYGQSDDDRVFRILVRYDGPEKQKYFESFGATLLRQNLPINLIPSELDSNATPDEIAKETQRFACDVVLSLKLREVSGQGTIAWKLASYLEASPRASGEEEKDSADWSTAADIYWLFFVEPLRAALLKPSKPWPLPIQAKKEKIIIEALSGTRIRGVTKEVLTVGKDGKAEAEINVPVTLYVEGTLQDHRTAPKLIFIEEGNWNVKLSQSTMPQYSATGSLTNFAFPSGAFEWNFLPGQAFVRIGIDQYLGGFYFQNRQTSTSFQWPVISVPLVVLQTGVAWYWSSPDDWVRFYSGADLGLRFMFPQLKYVGLDALVPLQLEIYGGAEIRLWEGGTWFLEMGPNFDWTVDPYLFQTLAKTDSAQFFFPLIGKSIYMEAPLYAKVGYRWSF